MFKKPCSNKTKHCEKMMTQCLIYTFLLGLYKIGLFLSFITNLVPKDQRALQIGCKLLAQMLKTNTILYSSWLLKDHTKHINF
jgi:hypothetical protein